MQRQLEDTLLAPKSTYTGGIRFNTTYARYHCHEGLAQVYRKLKDAGYTRTYDSMCRQIRKMKLDTPKKRKSYPKSNYRKDPATYPEERVQ
jgi:hypothetical protein